MSADYEQEQESLEQSVAALQAELDSYDADSVRADKFVELVSKYTDFTELTAAMINEFIDRVVVYEADKSSGERQQQVEIYLNFIGKWEAPALELSPEELASEAEKKRKLDQRRATQRRYEEKRRKEYREQRDAMQLTASQTEPAAPDTEQSA